eukprot:TCONS_00045936-protein
MARFKVIVIFLSFLVIIWLGYVYIYSNEKFGYLVSSTSSSNTYSSKIYQKLNFDISKNDVFSFVHIQKTGGTTMEKHLVINLKNGNCKCEQSKKPSCMCYRSVESKEIWLVCRYIQPKWPCGLHPDYASLATCTPDFIRKKHGQKNYRFLYGTLLREPVDRYLSEFRHRQRGASWEGSAINCKGKSFEGQNPRCYDGEIWLDLTLEKFLACPHNLAANRQTWMLSNVSDISCSVKSLMTKVNYQQRLLSIAKQTISEIAFFGLLEYPRESQFVFEKTFGLEFDEPFQLWDTGFAKVYIDGVNKELIEKVKKKNSLDVELYKFAKLVFFERYHYFVTLYGHPKFRAPSSESRFTLKDKKKRRLKENLPKSKAKQETLKRRIKAERARQAEEN